MPTRRTHIVRIPAADTEPGKDPSTFVDVEVLDAISFRTTGNREMILDFAGGTIVPYIVDDTGDGNAQTPGHATRRSHMQRVTSDDGKNFVDVEVLDCVAFRGENGQEWILNLPADGDPDANNPESASNEFNTTTHSGTANATRRVHEEKISSDLTKAKKDTDDFFTVTRTDMVAFRTIGGQQMILNLTSNDDPLSSDKRADTHVTPDGYDPTDKSANAVKPPLLKDTDDKNIYVFIPKNSGSITKLKDKRIAQGPLWWIRNVSGGKAYLIITMTGHAQQAGSVPPPPTFSVGGDAPVIEAEEPVTTSKFTPGVPSTQQLFFMWPQDKPFPTAETFGTLLSGFSYGGQIGQTIVGHGLRDNPDTGLFLSLQDAQDGADILNTLFNQQQGDFFPLTGPTQNYTFGTLIGVELDIVTPNAGAGVSSSTQRFLLGPIPEGASNFTASANGANQGNSCDAALEINVGGNVTSFDTMAGGQTAAEGNAGVSFGGSGNYTIAVDFDPSGDGTNSTVDVETSGGGGPAR